MSYPTYYANGGSQDNPPPQGPPTPPTPDNTGDAGDFASTDPAADPPDDDDSDGDGEGADRQQ